MEHSVELRIDNLLELNRFSEAISEAHQYLASSPDSINILTLLCRAHLGKDDLPKARDVAKRIISLAPDDAYAYFLMSIVQRSLHFFNEELSYAEQAARLEPDNPWYIRRLAEAQLQSGQLAKANQTCAQLIKLEPDSAIAHELMGDIQLQQDKYPEAEKHYRNALSIEPNNISVLNQLSLCLNGQKKHHEAIEILFNAIKRNPTSDVLRHNLFFYIKSYLDKPSLAKRRSTQFAQLPQPVQIFYNDYKNRTSIFQRYSNYLVALFWAVMLIATTFIFSLFSNS